MLSTLFAPKYALSSTLIAHQPDVAANAGTDELIRAQHMPKRMLGGLSLSSGEIEPVARRSAVRIGVVRGSHVLGTYGGSQDSMDMVNKSCRSLTVVDSSLTIMSDSMLQDSWSTRSCAR